MTGQHHEDPDERLTRLLELADGSRDLPPGQEERLLAAMLATASAPRVATDPGEFGSPAGTRIVEDAGTRTRERRSRQFAAMLVAASLVGAFVLVRGFLPTGPATPTIGAGVGLDDLSTIGTGTLCLEARDRIGRLGFDDAVAVQASVDVDPLEELADVLDEFDQRVSDGRVTAPADDVRERLRRAPPTLRLQARHVTNGDMDRAARTRARSTALILDEPALLDALGCPS